MVEHGNRNGRTVDHLIEEQLNNDGDSRLSDGGTVERLIGGTVKQRWRTRGTSDGGTVEHLMVKHLMVEQWNKDDGTVDYLMVEQWNRDGGTGELKWLK